MVKINSSTLYFITTPIFYVNAAPHIGHIHTVFLADAINLFNRLLNPKGKTIFSTGTDEHGLKVQLAASKKQVPCMEFCQTNSNKFRQLFDRHNLTFSDFIRTTEDRHIKAVESFWNELDKNNSIYKSTYQGWYSTNDETFVPESQIISSISDSDQEVFVSDSNGNKLEWYQEENYMFKLGQYLEDVYHWLRRDSPIKPRKFNELAISMLGTNGGEQNQGHAQSFSDISISRPTKRLDWAIKVPNDPNHTVYVWLDALISYLTVAGYPERLKRWPIDCQVIGKDILKFHAIYWPAFLMAAKMPLPKSIICHSHWLIDSMKMSKSKGNVVDPEFEADSLTEEGLRYYLLRSSTPHSDTDYSHKQAIRTANADLADNLGNLMSRCCAIKLNPKQVIPLTMFNDRISEAHGPICDELIKSLRSLPSQCEKHYQDANFSSAVDQIMACLRLANALFQDSQPWILIQKTAHDEKAMMEHNDILALMFECLRICAILLTPIIPKASLKILDKLNLGSSVPAWNDTKLRVMSGIGIIPKGAESRDLKPNREAIVFRKLKIL